MPDRIDPRSPLNKWEQLVHGVDGVRHPVTGIPIQRGSGALPVKEQARQHLQTILTNHGIDVAREIERKLNEWESNGGKVEMSAPYVNPEFSMKR